MILERDIKSWTVAFSVLTSEITSKGVMALKIQYYQVGFLKGCFEHLGLLSNNFRLKTMMKTFTRKCFFLYSVQS